MNKTPVSVSPDDQVIFFDGICNLCNWSVQFVIKRDKHNQFKFVALQSNLAKKLFADKPYLFQAPASVILISNNKLYVESTAALKIVRQLRGLWPLMYVFVLVPPVIRDWAYRLIANNRYKWFGKQEACMVPKPEWKNRFLD